MTKQEAKELSLEAWDWNERHPMLHKWDKPEKLKSKLENLTNWCPLCDLFLNKDLICPDCPLENCSIGSPYFIWASNMNDIETRQEAARKIIKLIEAWEPEK